MGRYPAFWGESCPSGALFFPCGGYPAFLGGYPVLSGRSSYLLCGVSCLPGWVSCPFRAVCGGGILPSWGVSCLLRGILSVRGGLLPLWGGILPSWQGILSFWGGLLPLFRGILPSWGVSGLLRGYPVASWGHPRLSGGYPAVRRGGVSCPFGMVFFPFVGGILPSWRVSRLPRGVSCPFRAVFFPCERYPAFVGGILPSAGYPVRLGRFSSLVGGYPACLGGYPVLPTFLGGTRPSAGSPVLLTRVSWLPGGILGFLGGILLCNGGGVLSFRGGLLSFCGGYPAFLGGILPYPAFWGVCCPSGAVFFPCGGVSCLLLLGWSSSLVNNPAFLGRMRPSAGYPVLLTRISWLPGGIRVSCCATALPAMDCLGIGAQVSGTASPFPPQQWEDAAGVSQSPAPSCTGRGCSSAPYRQTMVSV